MDRIDRPSWLPLVDLTGLTRDEDLVVTYIEVLAPQGWFPWLKFGSMSSIDPGKQVCRIAARMDNITDVEHDSCYAFAFDATHIALSYVNEGAVVFESCIAGANDDAESFGFPLPPKSSSSESKMPSTAFLARKKTRT